MELKVRKRSGYSVKYRKEKIAEAIRRAALETREFDETKSMELADKVEKEILKNLDGRKSISVEEIQDYVEKVLWNEYPQTARAYILYREKRANIRSLNRLAISDFVSGYINKAVWQVKENANISFSYQGLSLHVVSQVASAYWLNELFPSHVKKAHESGAIHIHDLQGIAPYCAGWSLEAILLEGFNGPEDKVYCSAPKHFSTALNQILNALMTLQQEFMGAQALNDIDFLLAPYVRKDKLSYKEVRQEIESFVYSLNVPARTGGQTPFTNFTCHLEVPSHLADVPVIGSEGTYKDYSHEAFMINKAFHDVLLKGDAKSKPFTFPIITYYLNKLPNDNLFYTVEAKRGSYYIANARNGGMSTDTARSMCCRLRIDTSSLGRGGFFFSAPLTGSVSVVTINIPQVAYESKKLEDFYAHLDYVLEIAYTAHEIRRKTIEKFADLGLYPYTVRYLKPVKEKRGKYFAQHFSTVGIVGVNEACQVLFNKTIDECLDFATELLKHLRKKCEEFSKRSGNLYNLEQTPAEGAGTRLCLKDVESKYPVPDGLKAYTNSTHLPAEKSGDIELLLKVHEALDPLYTGGTVMHLYLGEEISESGAKTLLDLCLNTKIPYFTLTPVFRYCSRDGIHPGKGEKCDICGAPVQTYARVVGYYRPVHLWNIGKKEEFKRRILIDATKKS